MASPPAKRIKLLPTSTPTPTNTRVIPAEILHRIIGHIDHNDKQTLGRCMQVSPTFNAIVAPRLYNTITLTDSSGLSDPFGGAKRGVFDIPVKKVRMKKAKGEQKTQGKEKDLGHIQLIFFEGNTAPDFIESTRSADAKKLLKSVKTVRLRLDTTPCHLHYRTMNNTISRFVGVEKVIFAGSNGQPVLSLSCLSTQPSTVVIHVKHPWRRSPFEWVAGPTHFRGDLIYIFLDRRKVDRPVQRNIYLDFTVDGLVAFAAIENRGSKTILVVNAPDVQYRGAAKQSMEECVIGLMELHKKENNDPTPDTDVVPPQCPTMKFLSMREYLRDYDWAGEFTDEEVRPWLEDEGFEMM